jgi:hypothetical protein
MPKFGKTWFNGAPFGTHKMVFTNFFNSIKRVPLGLRVRKSIVKKIIFRCRIGNGFIGSVKGKFYQDKYKYFVPSSINNPEGQPARDALKQAVLNWQTILTAEQKAEYNRRGKLNGNLQGYSLYIREYIKSVL